jgi:hypothetical protein
VAGAVALLAACGVLGGCTGSGQRPATTTPMALRLVAFDSCAQTLASLKKEAAAQVGPYGWQGDGSMLASMPQALGARLADGGQGNKLGAAPSAARVAAPGVPAEQHSTTNNQEAGVDEPDLVKTDGHRLVTIAGGQLRLVDLDRRRLQGTLRLPTVAADQLLLYGDRALVLASGNQVWDDAARPWTMRAASRLLLVDLAGPPRLLGNLALDGQQVDTRQVGSTARVVLRSAPHLPFVYPGPKLPPGAATRENRRILARSVVADWLPRYELEQGGTRRSGQLVGCTDVRHPDHYTGTSALTVLTVDLSRPLSTEDTVSVMADGDTVYATGSSLYVAARQWRPFRGGVPVPGVPGVPGGGAPPDTTAAVRTEVHKFDMSEPGRPRYIASGTVTGEVLNQFALSEHDGYLRVATTTGAGTGCCIDGSGSGGSDSSANAVVVLAQRGTSLTEVGRVDGLGKGERVYGVRFLGPVGYVVTFRQTDPLYTLDLSDPRHPRAVGELKINGYSAYLHPAGDGRLIGVGQDATDTGRRTGTQVSLFDIADPAHPRRLSQVQMVAGWSEAENDHHAFLYWPATGLVVVPVSRSGGLPVASGGDMLPPVPGPTEPSVGPTSGALVLRLHGETLPQVGAVSHPASRSHGVVAQPLDSAEVRRALVVGDTLWTASAAGVMASNQDTLGRLAWIPFS